MSLDKTNNIRDGNRGYLNSESTDFDPDSQLRNIYGKLKKDRAKNEGWTGSNYNTDAEDKEERYKSLAKSMETAAKYTTDSEEKKRLLDMGDYYRRLSQMDSTGRLT